MAVSISATTEIKYSQEYLDDILANNKILKELVTEKDDEILALKQSHKIERKISHISKALINPEDDEYEEVEDKGVQVDHEANEEQESNFKLTKAQEIIQKYQDFFEDLQSSYSLPKNLIKEIERLQDKYMELFTDNLVSTQNFCKEYDRPDTEEQKFSEDEPQIETLESYDEPLPVKNEDLNASHIKHKSKIPTLDMAKVQMLSSSEDDEDDEGEEEEQEQQQYPVDSVSSDDDPEALIQVLNDDDLGEEYKFDSEEAKQLDSDYEGDPEDDHADEAVEYELENNPIDFISRNIHVKEVNSSVSSQS